MVQRVPNFRIPVRHELLLRVGLIFDVFGDHVVSFWETWGSCWGDADFFGPLCFLARAKRKHIHVSAAPGGRGRHVGGSGRSNTGRRWRDGG